MIFMVMGPKTLFFGFLDPSGKGDACIRNCVRRDIYGFSGLFSELQAAREAAMCGE